MTLREIMSDFYQNTNDKAFNNALKCLTINGAKFDIWIKDLLKLYDIEVKDHEIIDMFEEVNVTFPRIKEVCRADFYTMITKSWTWARLSDKEKELCTGCFRDAFLYGNYKQRWEILNNCYNSFLAGCGYDSISWRDELVKEN